MTLHDDDAQQHGDTGGRPHEGCIIDDTAPKCLPVWFLVVMQFALPSVLIRYATRSDLDARDRGPPQAPKIWGYND
jgi:hypothetical protein